MGAKKDFIQACENKDSSRIIEILKDYPEDGLLTEMNIRRIIHTGDVELVKNIFNHYEIKSMFTYIKQAIYIQNVSICEYLLDGYIFDESDLDAIVKMIYYVSCHNEVLDVLEKLIDLYYAHGNKNYILEAANNASEEALRIFQKKVPGFNKKREKNEKRSDSGIQSRELDMSGVPSALNEIFEEEARRKEAAKLPWEEHEDAISLLVAIENSEITDQVIISLLDAGAKFQFDGEAMRLAQKTGRLLVVEHMNKLIENKR